MTDVIMWIPHGYDNRISRKELCFLTSLDDRIVRNEIEKHNCGDKDPVISIDSGYFIPNMDDEQDRHYANVYFKKEFHRIRARLNSLNALHKTLKGAADESRED